MRTSVINRFAKLAPLSVATVLLTAGLTVGTATTAWACGDQPAPAATEQPWEHHGTDTSSAFIPQLPDRITVGGPKVEFGVEMYNGTGEAYRSIAPRVSLWNPQSADSANAGKPVNLRPQDITLEAMVGGRWTNLPLKQSCDPALNADVTALRGPLEDGRANRTLFRIGLKNSTPAVQKSLEIHIGVGAKPLTLTMARPAPSAAPATAAPATKPAAKPAAKPAKVPAEAPKSTPSAPAPATTPPPVTASPTAPATPAVTEPADKPATELATTGPKTSTFVLAGGGAALLALGTGSILVARRRTAR
ncbi:hypothetical protein ACIRBX_06120 [Kitasatospora sp. NPDC096147]|uniref:hypothetical protein n=1 Tax=Kitasatospora sp. NPDC096147 TaxID=3364093 RepID=UPI0038131C5A